MYKKSNVWGMELQALFFYKNIPGKDEQWKVLVKYWIRDMYGERQRKAEEKAKRQR